MKRPPGLWVLLSAGVLWLSMQDAYGRRTTKTTTTTTTTTTEAPEEDEEAATTDLPSDGNVTKPTLTGNPQLDYVWDPNLPKELNGYNLSDYPFYERVPEDIDFKCDGLHDGFYASVKHKCQVYHHCLFGTRYDFLCANYTAFDQTLFNCNFVSNVDCENSKKYWNRNDELYKTKSTTTQAPVVYNFHTPPPGYQIVPEYLPQRPRASPPQLVPQPQQPQIVPQQQTPLLIPIEPVRRPRPPARRRPMYDYYDEDDYDTRPVMRRKRPRRPVLYDDEYDDDYEEERYDRRGGSRRRRPYNRRPMRREKDRRRDYYYEDDDYEEDFVLEKKPKNKRRKTKGDDYEDDEDGTGKRRPQLSRTTTDKSKRANTNKRPLDDHEDDYDNDEVTETRKKVDNKGRGSTTYNNAGTKKTPRLGVRRPPSEEPEEDLQQADGVRAYERSRKSNRESNYEKPASDAGRPIIKPVSGTIYDRPRVAPRINLPVPKNVANKYAYKPIGSEDIQVESSQIDTTRVISNLAIDEVKDTYVETTPNVNKRRKIDRTAIRKRPTFSNTESTTSRRRTEEASSTNAAPFVRKYKRPFLTSRGGSPYASRSLEPVGAKATDELDEEEEEMLQDAPYQPQKNEKQVLPENASTKTAAADAEQLKQQTPTRIVVPIRARPTTTTVAPTSTTTFQPLTTSTESQIKSDADILNGNYDVTINEALSPILPNLPIRGQPTGFSNANDDDYNIYNDNYDGKFKKPPKYVLYDHVGPSGSYYV